MTPAQEREIETLCYFWPQILEHNNITNEHIQKYFEWSEKGLHKQDIKLSGFTDGFNALVNAKQWRGRTIHELWEPGVLEGTMPYFTLLGGNEIYLSYWERIKFFFQTGKWRRFYHSPPPDSVVKFMAKEMFKGADEKLILQLYSQLLLEK